jgi:aminoglycoside phosphotransferase (APT) family kinase protein
MGDDEDAVGPVEPDHLVTSTRDEEELGQRLSAWLAARPEVSGPLRLAAVERPDANGMSSETLMFEAAWTGGGGRFVARLRPAADAFPIFPTYDLERQVQVMRLVADGTEVPVPTVRWYEPDEAPLGAPFFVMDRVDGQVPPDVMPYTFDGSWLVEATPAQLAVLQERTVDVIAGIHSVEVSAEVAASLDHHPGDVDAPTTTGAPAGGSALRRHLGRERAFFEWVRGGWDMPILEDAFDWLEERWPTAADAEPPVVCWGDARIGNILYRDFEPQAVLDWEMATLGPRELDVGWCIFLHRFFQDIATDFGMAGLPDLFDRHAVAARYAARSGHELRDLDWFVVYAALRHGIVMTRAMGRRVHFGEHPMPDDPQDLVLHRASIERLLAGTYW